MYLALAAVFVIGVLVVPLRRRVAVLEARLGLVPSAGQDSPGQAVPLPIAEEKTERHALDRRGPGLGVPS
jgi:hypothetical protein